jgi:hypothetical protein
MRPHVPIELIDWLAFACRGSDLDVVAGVREASRDA